MVWVRGDFLHRLGCFSGSFLHAAYTRYQSVSGSGLALEKPFSLVSSGYPHIPAWNQQALLQGKYLGFSCGLSSISLISL